MLIDHKIIDSIGNSSFLEMMFRQSLNPIVITEANLDEPGPRFVYINPAFTKMTGWRLEEIKDKTPRILQGEKTDKCMLNQLKQKCQRGEPFSGRTINYKKDGSEYVVEWNISPIFDDSGDIAYYFSFQKDVTKEVELERKEKELSNLLDVSTKAAGITHILNTALTTAYGRLELMEIVIQSKSIHLYEELREDIEPLRQSLNSIGFLSDSIRCLSNEIQDEYTLVDVVEVVLEAMKHNEDEAKYVALYMDKVTYTDSNKTDVYAQRRAVYMVISLLLHSIAKEIKNIEKAAVAIDVIALDESSVEVDFKINSTEAYEMLKGCFDNPLENLTLKQRPELFTNIFIAHKIALERNMETELIKEDDGTIVKLLLRST
jgi:PAS domain S-box-containing protein